MNKPKLLVFASGEAAPDKGGSGFKTLVESMVEGVLRAEIVGVVSNHIGGGVETKTRELNAKYGLDIPFFHFQRPHTAEGYRTFAEATGAEFVALSGWLRLVSGLNPKTTFNIHPGPLPRFGGKGLYGHHVHEAVLDAYRRDELTHSAVTMHFVTEEYDRGPTIFSVPVPIEPGDTAETLGKRVNRSEHIWQPIITNKVVNGEIIWDGVNPDSLRGAEIIDRPIAA